MARNPVPAQFGLVKRVLRRAFPVSLVLFTFVLCFVTGELALRLLDGYAIWPPQLVRSGPSASAASAGDAYLRKKVDKIVRALPVGDDVDRAWFREKFPIRAPKKPLKIVDRLASEAAGRGADIFDSTKIWNIHFFRDNVCASPGQLEYLRTRVAPNILSFSTADKSPYPRFRLVPDTTLPWGLTLNNYGWRSEDIPLNKPPRTIRIAFVGGSTTINAHGPGLSYPELVGLWLQRWTRAAGLDLRTEVINAGRSGFTSEDIAAVVKLELAPLEPDFVVYYEGSNQFAFGELLAFEGPLAKTHAKLALTARQINRRFLDNAMQRSMRYSAVARRISPLLGLFHHGDGVPEPDKPPHKLLFPAGVDEQAPNLEAANLPLGLTRILSDLDAIRSDLRDHDGQLVLSTFVWMIEDGWVLNPVRNASLFRNMNEKFWPATYADMRRMADFQNRVLRNYAAKHRIPLLDIAALLPSDPDLTSDGIHMPPDGVRLRAWVTFNELANLIRRQIASKRLPRADRQTLAEHPHLGEMTLTRWYPCDGAER